MKHVAKEEKETEELINEDQKISPEFSKLISFGGGKKDDGDWLSNLPDGTIFLAQLKPQQAPKHALHEFQVVGKIKDERKGTIAVKLCQIVDTNEANVFVCPGEFCKLYDLYILVQEGKDGS